MVESQGTAPAGGNGDYEDKQSVGAQTVKSISVFFPCYNEAGMVDDLTAKAVEVLEEISDDYEVIIVDDGSTDGTGEKADRIAESNSRVKVVHHKPNSGYGGALQSGFKAATKEFVFYTDGDGQFDIGELPKLVNIIDDCDIVSGYRIKRSDSFIRKLNAAGWNRLVCLLFGMKIRDIDCAFKLYRRKIFDDIEMRSMGALIDTEILARATRKGYKIKQVGVHHYPRTAGSSTGANIKVILKAFVELAKLYREIVKTS
jgi:glycosyltransferase involved in cell wall biosynthesis